ncbi:hypothetical protein MGLY_07940 [Neomoorella glycerini]|uniref:ATP-binding protein n=1 Tax=Neomoorella glycerini TaxID=55779 RepID=A0A6I5ZPJ6_9FIRM|nr:ATP-binding protein [Moorella glycerini]QGP91461.1 hypothetical protein MGLY_07940 [Moorella glycerini]
MVFVNRQTELNWLEEVYRSGRAQLLVLYGRRRVGKTELLRFFCREKKHVFFVADLAPDREQLAAFSQRLWERAYGQAETGFSFPSWEAAFRFMGGLARQEQLIVVLDEFPYLMEANPAIPSILQKVWDEELRNTGVICILCGSYVGVMEREVLGYKSALYGRRTGQYLIEPLHFHDIAGFFPGRDSLWLVEAYAVLGGVPAYLLEFMDEDDLFAGIARRVLRRGTFLYEEPRFLLMQELREPANYFAVLRAIAHGKTRLNEITQAAGLHDRSATSRYLDILRDMGLIRRLVPVTEKQPQKSRRGIYRLRDQFLRFWFRFVYPNRSDLEEGETERVLETRIKPHFPDFVGPVFEEVCRQHLRFLGQRGKLSFYPYRLGSWWDGQNELDLLAINEDESAILVGECKWWGKPVGANVLSELQQKVKAVVPHFQRPPQVYYALFARNGFSEELHQKAAERHDLLLIEACQFHGNGNL